MDSEGAELGKGYELYRWEKRKADGQAVILPTYYIRHGAKDTCTLTDRLKDYFARDENGSPSIWRMGVLGGQPRNLLDGARAPAPSPEHRLQLPRFRTS